MADLYYLSDEAYEYLRSIATEQGFINPVSQRADGISKFLRMLSFQSFSDTRPEEVIESDIDLIRDGKVPIWTAGFARKPRGLELDDNTLLRYVHVALNNEISMGRAYRGGPMWRSMISITGAVLEAIGCEWLTPNYWPYQPRKDRYVQEIKPA